MSDYRLKIFQSVAKNLSFTKASQELYLSQPAISKHIHELEEMYQVRLFNRTGGHITLTQAGELLLHHAEIILGAYQQLAFEINLLHEDHQGVLRLGASTTISQYVLPPILAKFIAQYPHVSLFVLSGNSEEIQTALQDHRIDLGLVEGVSRLSDLRYDTFLGDELVAVVHTHSHLSATLPDEITIHQLQHIPLVLRERGSGTLEVIEKALQAKKISLSALQVKMFLGSTESIKLFLEHSECMGIVSIRSISKELLAGRFRIIDIQDLTMLRDFNFVHLRGPIIGLPQFFMKFVQSAEK